MFTRSGGTLAATSIFQQAENRSEPFMSQQIESFRLSNGLTVLIENDVQTFSRGHDVAHSERMCP